MTRIGISDAASVSTSTSRVASDSIAIAETTSVAFAPADQAQDWRRRWSEIERRAAQLAQPRSGAMSGDSIHVAREELRSFYIDCYHLKDALIAEGAVAKEAVESAVSATPTLALLADLANLGKHAKLDRKSRSGDAPKYGDASANTFQSGWRLSQPILHLGATRDGLDVAAEAVDAWRQLLVGWQLV